MARARLGVLLGSAPFEAGTATADLDPVTPWGEAAEIPRVWQTPTLDLIMIRRHGPEGALAPDAVNYRANLWLLRAAGARHVLATHTVGSIDPGLAVGDLVLPEDLIDYSWGRAHTFDDQRRHVDLTRPYSATLQRAVTAADPTVRIGGVYACTQGPRLETAAEIRRLARDGCTVVGMTGMPEAALARELGLEYASLCFVVNPAAGLGPDEVDMAALIAASELGADRIRELIGALALDVEPGGD